MDELHRAIQQAEELDASGNPFYVIDASCAFVSTHTAPTVITEEFTEPSPVHRLPIRGDVLLRVFCDVGTVRLRWDGYAAALYEAQEIVLFNGGGFPAINCPCSIFYSASDPNARIFTEWEIYAGRQRDVLERWRDPFDADRGVKIWSGKNLFVCIGVNTPIGKTIQQIAPKEKPAPSQW